MALLDEANLAAEAAKRAKFRTNHVGTKLNAGELAKLEALTLKRGVTHGELIRGLILGEVAREKEPAPGGASERGAGGDYGAASTADERVAEAGDGGDDDA